MKRIGKKPKEWKPSRNLVIGNGIATTRFNREKKQPNTKVKPTISVKEKEMKNYSPHQRKTIREEKADSKFHHQTMKNEHDNLFRNNEESRLENEFFRQSRKLETVMQDETKRKINNFNRRYKYQYRKRYM